MDDEGDERRWRRVQGVTEGRDERWEGGRGAERWRREEWETRDEGERKGGDVGRRRGNRGR
jgi:hypothetical protein